MLHIMMSFKLSLLVNEPTRIVDYYNTYLDNCVTNITSKTLIVNIQYCDWVSMLNILFNSTYE